MTAVGRGFAPKLGHTKDDDTTGVKDLVVCITIYGDRHYKDIPGSIARVWYCIPVPDFYLMLHGFRYQRNTLNDYTIQKRYRDT